MRQWIQVIQLMITGKKAKAYIYPLLSLSSRSNFCLKPANEHPEIISSSEIFHSFTTLFMKENLATSNVTLFLFNFNEWPRRLDCDRSKNTSWSIFSYPLKILKTSIKSPLYLRVSSVVKPSIFNLSSYPISDKPEINFVALFVPFPKHLYLF